MEISVAGQAAAFTGAIALGLGVGLLYDLLRLLRCRLRLPLLGSVLDLMFWAAVTLALFLYVIAATGGEVRLYVLLAVFGGAVAYFLGLSAWVMSLGNLLADGLAFLARLILLPLRLFWLAVKKIEKNLKNVFHYRRKWFTIKATFEGMEDAARFGAARREEGESHACSKSRIVDQNSDPGAPDRRGDLSAGTQQPDGSGPGPERGSDQTGRGADADKRRPGRRHRAQR